MAMNPEEYQFTEYETVYVRANPLDLGPGSVLEVGMLSSRVAFDGGTRWVANQALVKGEFFDNPSDQRGWVITSIDYSRLAGLMK